MIELDDIACTLAGRTVRLTRQPWTTAQPAILALRGARAADLGLSDDGDHDALHLTAEADGAVVAAIRAHFADRSRFDFEPLLPCQIPAAARAEVVSITRFVVDEAHAAHLRPLLSAMITEIFRLSWRRGYRIALFTATERLAPIYARLMTAEIVSPPSAHPRTGRSVQVLAFAPLTWRPDHPMASRILRDGDRMSPQTTAFLDALRSARRGARAAA